MYRITEFLDSLEHYELVKLKQDLEKGNIDLAKSIKEKIAELKDKRKPKQGETKSGDQS